MPISFKMNWLSEKKRQFDTKRIQSWFWNWTLFKMPIKIFIANPVTWVINTTDNTFVQRPPSVWTRETIIWAKLYEKGAVAISIKPCQPALVDLVKHCLPSWTLYRLLMTLRRRKTLREKEKILVTSIFSSTHNVFYPSQEEFLFLIYITAVVCKYFESRPVFNFVVWLRVG